jgi:hypothetical protein
MIRFLFICLASLSIILTLSCSKSVGDRPAGDQIFVAAPSDLSGFKVIYKVNVDLTHSNDAVDTARQAQFESTADRIRHRLSEAKLPYSIWRETDSTFSIGIRNDAFVGKDSANVTELVRTLIITTGRFSVRWTNPRKKPLLQPTQIAAIEQTRSTVKGADQTVLTLKFQGESEARLYQGTGTFVSGDSLSLQVDAFRFASIPVSGRLRSLSFSIDLKSLEGLVVYCCLESGELPAPTRLDLPRQQYAKELRPVSGPPVPITTDMLDLLTNSYLLRAASCWETFRQKQEQPANPYETDEQKRAQIAAAATQSLDCLSELYNQAKTWAFRISSPISQVTYDANTQIATLQLAEWSIPSTEGPASVGGIYRGQQYPNLCYALEPLWTHKYNSNTVSPRHYLQGTLRVPVPINKAKDNDIVGVRGSINLVVRFSSRELKDGVIGYKQPVYFPCVELLSGKWVVHDDTLYTCGSDSNQSVGSLSAPGKPAIFEQLPDEAVPYAFQRGVDSSDLIRVHRRLMRDLGLDIDAVNSATAFNDSLPRGYVRIDGLPATATVAVDGVLCGNQTSIGPLLVGRHNIIIRNDYCAPHIASLEVRAYDTTSYSYQPLHLGGTWVPNWLADRSIANGETDLRRSSISVDEHDKTLTVSYRGKEYQVEVGTNAEFWKLYKQASFEFDCGAERGVIRQADCVGFNFMAPSDADEVFEHFFFFFSKGGNCLIKRAYTDDQTYLGKKIHPGLQPQEPVCLVRPLL